jgi:hypothetical protein
MSTKKERIIEEIARIKREIPNVETFNRLLGDRIRDSLDHVIPYDEYRVRKWKKELILSIIGVHVLETKIVDLRMELIQVWSDEKRVPIPIPYEIFTE